MAGRTKIGQYPKVKRVLTDAEKERFAKAQANRELLYAYLVIGGIVVGIMLLMWWPFGGH